MNILFEDEDLEELIFTGKNKRYKKYSRDMKFMTNLLNVYNYIRAAENVKALEAYSFLHYEKLRHIDLSSVRIMNNRVERLLFREFEDGISITIIELDNTHYGNKK